MLMLLFHTGDSQYALPVSDIVAVTPGVQLESMPLAPAYIAGLFNYHGQHVPVIDLCQLILERACLDSLTTRIVLVNFPQHNGKHRLLGLLAERVTDTINMGDNTFSSTGIAVADAPYLGQAAQSELGLIQQLSISELLPAAVQASLFAAETD
jgi:chemotaxis-related protein WspB